MSKGSKVEAMRALREAEAKASEKRAKEKAEAPLTEVERRKLNDLEQIIEHGLQTFVEVGASLAMIREQKLYRTSHGTFEAYCQDRWGWSDRRARQLISSSEFVLSTKTETGKIFPVTTEPHAVELVDVPPERRAEVLETATKAAEVEGKKLTARHVREAAAPHRPKKQSKEARVRDIVAENEPVEEGREESEGPESGAQPATTPHPSAGAPEHDERLAYLLNAESALAHAASFRGLGMAAVQQVLEEVRRVIAMLRQEQAA